MNPISQRSYHQVVTRIPWLPVLASLPVDALMLVYSPQIRTTISAMANPSSFPIICQRMLERLTKVFPKDTVLTDSPVPYDVKPVALQLNPETDRTSIIFTGEIRVRTTDRLEVQVDSLEVVYKDRMVAVTAMAAPFRRP
ncbi:hypothetical protein EJ08DRAFT_496378 [Tothia fuscella]|uniref:Uncharacterized protein n=1 Tax=Tothia fuscella TaxID=1048955 RepID=A0A9P4NXH3_9PEZI|nr:hypothetical protein EJ08DRAFT_496378 [Tothia fuscella]